MKKIDAFKLLCGLLQIAGLLILVFLQPTPPAKQVFLTLMGFAAIAAYFLPGSDIKIVDRFIAPLAAICGIGLIAFAFAA